MSDSSVQYAEQSESQSLKKWLKSMEIISGHDLCDKVLSHPDGGVEALIDLAGGQETDWLEFKAAPWPVEIIESGLNRADYHWHIAKAAVAMANSRGGCILVGIAEPNLEPVDLQKGDPREFFANKDNFLRYMRRVVEPDSGNWKCQKAGNWKLNGSLSPLLRLRFLSYRGFDIVAILVNPLPPGASLVIASRQESALPTNFASQAFMRQALTGGAK